MPRRPATTEEKRLLARLGRPHPVWIVVSAGWPVAMLFLTALGLYYLVTGTRTLAQSLFVAARGCRWPRRLSLSPAPLRSLRRRGSLLVAASPRRRGSRRDAALYRPRYRAGL